MTRNKILESITKDLPLDSVGWAYAQEDYHIQVARLDLLEEIRIDYCSTIGPQQSVHDWQAEFNEKFIQPVSKNEEEFFWDGTDTCEDCGWTALLEDLNSNRCDECESHYATSVRVRLMFMKLIYTRRIV